MSGFSNPLVGGGGGLVYPSIHSPNFVHGSAGWSINKDGTLEANSATIRGTVTAGMFAGTQFVINSLGAFFYSGTPALGNLIASIAAAGGANDGLGNPFNAGFTRYQGTGYIEVDSGGGAPVIFFRPDGATHITTVSQIVATIQFPAAVNEQEILQISSGAESSGDQALYQLLAEAADASAGAEHLFIVGLVTVFQVTKTQLTSVKVHFFSAGINVTGGIVGDTLNLTSTLLVGGAATLNGGLKSTGNAEFDLSVTFPTGDAAESIPMKAFPTVSGSGATRFLVTQLRTAQVAGAPAGALAGINFDSTSVDLTTTPARLVLFSQDGTNTNTVTLTPTNTTFTTDLDIIAIGRGLKVAEGANAKQGTAVLAAGTATVANTSITANSRIFLTSQADGGTPGFVRVSARVAGTSFTIKSSSAADTSTIAYEIFEPG